ncbi:MAG: trimeric intracellular cation channel family protein [Verrucomicrobiae bacterium]|nr:trimeric intracellular cation channel family protein [Verrucomicrobiae bacterium]MCB1086360.1 trimeric intracellular cation channel family protein [Verrucomicrobiae bacterium]
MPMDWFFFIDISGVVIVAVTGCLAAARKSLDLFGAVLFAVLTGIGGGTLRDLLLDLPVFWIQKPVYVIAAAISGLITFVWMRYSRVPHGTLRTADALALGFYTIIGTEKALQVGAQPVIAAMMGLATGVAGGAIRDLLAAETPMILRREIYATASLLGATLLVGLDSMAVEKLWSWPAAFLVIVGLRLAALRWGLSLPSALEKHGSQS